MTEQERIEEIQRLRDKKVELLNKYGVFGGGTMVNNMHMYINKQLEVLGVYENHELSYEEWIKS